MANIPYHDSNLFNTGTNIILTSPNSEFQYQFAQTKDTIGLDSEMYNEFLKNAISRFRKSPTYRGYKSHLYDIGMDRCQVLGNITDQMATLEMHHNFLNIHDIALMITEHTLNTVGYITTFDLVQLLKTEHKLDNVPLVMLCKTVHQLYHANDEFILPASMCFGNWKVLLDKYKYGITLTIAYKIINFLKRSIELEKNKDEYADRELLDLRENILNWSVYITELQSGIKYFNGQPINQIPVNGTGY